MAVLGPGLIFAGLPLAAGASVWSYMKHPGSGLARAALAVAAVECLVAAGWLWRSWGS